MRLVLILLLDLVEEGGEADLDEANDDPGDPSVDLPLLVPACAACAAATAAATALALTTGTGSGNLTPGKVMGYILLLLETFSKSLMSASLTMVMGADNIGPGVDNWS